MSCAPVRSPVAREPTAASVGLATNGGQLQLGALILGGILVIGGTALIVVRAHNDSTAAQGE